MISIFASAQTKKDFNKEIYISELRKDFHSLTAQKYLKNVVRNKILHSKNRFLNISLDNKEIKKERFSVEIISDTKYQVDKKIYAEGNVVVLFKDGEVRTDKLIYDEEEKLF